MRTKKIIKEAKSVLEDTLKSLDKNKKLSKKKIAKEKINWDFPLSSTINFFDANMSYELTGYRPITKYEGLDFDPGWFIVSRSNYLSTGHYTSYLPGSKGYRDFWHEEYRRCRDGYTVNGYTITGEHYFFLNYYQLPIITEGKKAGSGRLMNFPKFFVSQYQFFHYVDLAKRLHKHIVLMKARGVGFSEISASMAINQYTTIKSSVTMIACYDKGKLERTLSKAWAALQFLDTHTDGGMFKLRQLSDTALIKKSGHFNMSKGNKVPAGWQSMIEGVIADDPQKIRGDRVDLMILDEAGCHAPGTEVLMYDKSIKKVEDVVVGDLLTGPDGTERTVLSLHHGIDKMYKIIADDGSRQIVNSRHIVYCKKRKYGKFVNLLIEAEDLYNDLQEYPYHFCDYRLVKLKSIDNPDERSFHQFLVLNYKEGEYYGFTLDKDQLFLLSDLTICHNSWPSLLKAFVQAQALVEVQGVAFGTIQAGGTGGDKGPALAGLNTIYYHPEPYGVLPYRHNYTSDGSTILSGYFIPAFTQSMVEGFTDERGWCDEERNKELLQKKRDQYLNVPQSLIHHQAEYCWTAEEAFALEGDNKFNKILLSEQLALIRLQHQGPRPVAGRLDYIYKDGRHEPENIVGFKWTPDRDGKILILEHPAWSECYMQDIKKAQREADRKGERYEAPPIYQEMSDLYVAGVDGIDIGKNQTSSETRDPSDFCLVIKRRAYGMRDPQIVCVYKDRPNEVRTAYKTAMALIRYYNCRVNVEATRVGFINWARYTSQLKWFMRRPQATIQNLKTGNTKAYGTPATSTIISMQNELIASFVEDYYHTIWFEDVLDQLIRYSDENKTKFDIIAAMGMMELADQELTGRVPIIIKPSEEEFVNFGYYKDEYGFRHWGVIPKKVNQTVKYGGGQAYDPYRVETSDTRYHQEYIP